MGVKCAYDSEAIGHIHGHLPVLLGETHGGSRDWRGVVTRSAAEAAAFGGPGRYGRAAAATGGRGGSEISRIRGSGKIEGRRAGAEIRRRFEKGERRPDRKTAARI